MTFFSSLNFKLLGIGIALLVTGYILLGQGPVDNPLSRSVAPALLVLAYCVILPLSIIFRGNKKSANTNVKQVKEEKKQGV